MAAAPKVEKVEPGPKMVQVVIAQRRSLIVPVVVGQRREGDKLVDLVVHRSMPAGSVVEVELGEIAALHAGGFLEPGTYVETAPPAPVTLDPVPTINGNDGAIIGGDRG